jgi:hypothetical protein
MRRPAAIRITLLRSRQTRGLYSLTKNLDLHSIDQLRRWVRSGISFVVIDPEAGQM